MVAWRVARWERRWDFLIVVEVMLLLALFQQRLSELRAKSVPFIFSLRLLGLSEVFDCVDLDLCATPALSDLCPCSALYCPSSTQTGESSFPQKRRGIKEIIIDN
eukprot:scaffold344_cov178-Ochromonas_danica.AAC.22